MYQDTRAKLTKYAAQMRCFDEPLSLKGNSETEEFEQFVIQFAYCDSDTSSVKCKSSKAAAFEMQGKAILLLSNQRTASPKVNQGLNL